MTVDYLFLARNGTTAADGTFTVFAGGLDSVTLSECPGTFELVAVGRISGVDLGAAPLDGYLDFFDPTGASMLTDEFRLSLDLIDPPREAPEVAVGPGGENFILGPLALPVDLPGRHRLAVRFVRRGAAPPETAQAAVELTIKVRDARDRADQPEDRPAAAVR